jgi:6-phosphogluconolactonase (cycloisomerase 2 family)
MAKLNSGTRIYGNTAIDTFLTVSGGIASNSNTTGTLIVTGGAGITGNLYSGNVYITGTSNGITFADGTVQTTAASGAANDASARANTVYLQGALGSANANVIIIQGVDVGQNARMTIIEGVDSGQNARMTISEGVDLSQNVRIDYSNTAITIIQGTDTSQNARMVIIEGTDTSQNARMVIIEGTDVTQNTRLTVSEGVDASQNVRIDYSNSAITIIQGTDTSQNARMTIIEGVNASQNVRLDFSNTITNFGIIKVSGQPDVIANVIESQLTLVAGSNMTIATDGVSNTITFSSTGGGGGGPTTAFSRVIISGQPDAIANIANSPLTLVAGSGITLATNGVANSITITSTGGGGGSSSGYLANSVIIANSSGYLSNTANLLYFDANNTTKLTGTVIAGRGLVAANSFIQSFYPIAAPTPIITAGSGLLTPTQNVTTSFGSGGTQNWQWSTIDPRGKFLYTTSTANNIVTQWTIDKTTGSLSNTYSKVITNGTPNHIKVDPTGRFMYVSTGSSGIDQYSINQTTGALTFVLNGSESNGQIAIDPTGRFLYTYKYVANPDIYFYSINQNTGQLTLTGSILAGDGNGIHSAIVDPTGRFLYVYTNYTNNVVTFSINQNNGILTLLNNQGTGLFGPGTGSILTDPAGRFLYITGGAFGEIIVFAIDQISGIPYPISSSSISFASFSYPYGLVIDPTGKYLYVALAGSSQSIYIYSINQNTGKLTAIIDVNGVIPIDLGPYQLLIEPTGRFLYLGNYGSNKISAFNINNFSAGSANVALLNVNTTNIVQANITQATITQANVNVLYANTIYTNLPSVLNDISNEFDNLKCVFNLKLDQANVTSIVDSKNLEVFVNGYRLSPYVKQLTYPWLATYDSYKGYRAVSTNTKTDLIIYNAPAPGDQAMVSIINNSSAPQTRKYPYSAATIALGD